MCVRFSTNLKDHGSAALGTELHRLCPQWVSAQVVRHGESVLYVHPQYIRSFLLFCRDSMLYQIKACIDLCCVDYPFREHRFTLVYMLCSVHSPGRKTLVRRSVTYGGLGLCSQLVAGPSIVKRQRRTSVTGWLVFERLN